MAEKSLSAKALVVTGLEAEYITSATVPALTTGTFAPTGDQFVVPNDGKTFLHVENGLLDLDVTIESPRLFGGLAVEDRVVTVPAGENRFIGPVSREVHGNPMKFALSKVTNVSLSVIRFP